MAWQDSSIDVIKNYFGFRHLIASIIKSSPSWSGPDLHVLERELNLLLNNVNERVHGFDLSQTASAFELRPTMKAALRSVLLQERHLHEIVFIVQETFVVFVLRGRY